MLIIFLLELAYYFFFYYSNLYSYCLHRAQSYPLRCALYVTSFISCNYCVIIKIVGTTSCSLLRISKYVSFTQTSPKLPEHPHYRNSRVRPYNLPERIYSTVLRPFLRISTRTPRTRTSAPEKYFHRLIPSPNVPDAGNAFRSVYLILARGSAFQASLISAVKSATRGKGGGRNGAN